MLNGLIHSATNEWINLFLIKEGFLERKNSNSKYFIFFLDPNSKRVKIKEFIRSINFFFWDTSHQPKESSNSIQQWLIKQKKVGTVDISYVPFFFIFIFITLFHFLVEFVKCFQHLGDIFFYLALLILCVFFFVFIYLLCFVFLLNIYQTVISIRRKNSYFFCL